VTCKEGGVEVFLENAPIDNLGGMSWKKPHNKPMDKVE